MSHAEASSDTYILLRQATTVLLMFQVAYMVARIFNSGENSGAMTGVFAATILQLGLTRRLSVNPQGNHTTRYIVLWRYGALTLLGVISVVVAFNTYAPDAIPNGVPTLIAMLVPAVIALKGAVLGKLPPNRVLGLRLRWTRQSRLAWELAHRLMGRILFFGGLIGVVTAPFVPYLAAFAGIAALIMVGVTAGVIKSWRVWQSDPERLSAG